MALLELVTVDEVKQYPGLDALSDADTFWLERLSRGFSQAAESYTDRYFLLEERTMQFDHNGNTASLQLPAFGDDSGSIANLWQDLDRGFASDTLIAASDYYFDPRTGIVTLDARMFFAGRGILKVQWTGGLAANADGVPEDMKLAAIMQVAAWWQHRHDLSLERRTTSSGTIEIFENDFLPQVRAILDLYTVGNL